MKSKLFCLMTIFALITQLQGQMLEFKNSRKITQEGKNLSRLEIHDLMKDNPKSLQIYKSGKTLRTLGDISFFGGLAIAISGVVLNNFTSIGDTEVPMESYPWQHYYGGTYTDKKYTISIVSLMLGGAMLVTTIPLKISGKKKIKKSVEQYNQSLLSAEVVNDTEYKFSLISNQEGIGIRFMF